MFENRGLPYHAEAGLSEDLGNLEAQGLWED